MASSLLTSVSTPVTLCIMSDKTLPHTHGLSQVARERRRELRALSRQLQAAEIKARELRHKLDRHLYMWHEDGSSVTDLSLDAGISRETVYRSIDRFRAELASQGLAEKAR